MFITSIFVNRILRKINSDNAVGTFLCTVSQPFSMTKLELEILDAFGFRYCYYKINHRRSNRLPIYISKINSKAFYRCLASMEITSMF